MRFSTTYLLTFATVAFVLVTFEASDFALDEASISAARSTWAW